MEGFDRRRPVRGKELFFLSPESKLMATAVKTEPRGRFEVAAPQPLFDTPVPSITPGFNQYPYAVAADGKRFLLLTSGSEKADAPLTVVVNWLAGVKK